MGRLNFRCPFCEKSVLAPRSLEGQGLDCPKCGEFVARWPAPEPSIDLPLEDEGRPQRRKHKEAPPQQYKEAPPQLVFACYVMTGMAAATTFLMPCVWFLGVPLAVGSLIAALFLYANYRNNSGVAACVAVSLVTMVAGFVQAEKVAKILREADEDTQPRRVR